MNARCVCPTVHVEGREIPEWPEVECPIHGLKDDAEPAHPLSKHAQEITIAWCYVQANRDGSWFHYENSRTRWETPAEVQRRLYGEAMGRAA